MKHNIENIIRHSEVSEKAIERYLTKSVGAVGGECLKYANSNMTGYPDRIVLLPCGVTVWVELKSKGKKPTKLQALRHERLRALGQQVVVIDSKTGVDELLGDYGRDED